MARTLNLHVVEAGAGGSRRPLAIIYPLCEPSQVALLMASTWYVYVLECADGTLYTGITTDLQRRVYEHNHTAAAARYTRCRRPVELVAHWSYPNQSAAASAEWHFKQLARDDKLAHIERGVAPTVT